MSIKRVVPDFASRSPQEAQTFYSDVFGFQPVMDHGWIVTMTDPGNPASQLTLMSHDETAPVVPDVSIGQMTSTVPRVLQLPLAQRSFIR